MMSLKAIEYGSLASSELLNNNFLYLEEKVAETAGDLNINTSSLLSNIATINTRLSEQSEALTDAIEVFNSKITEMYSKLAIVINNMSFVPDWSNMYNVQSLSNFAVSVNGYLIILPADAENGIININDKQVEIFSENNPVGSLLVLPVKDGDVVSTGMNIIRTYFLPVSKISSEAQ